MSPFGVVAADVLISNLQLAVFVSDKVPEIVKGDSGRFRQIIINLVGNSVKVSSVSRVSVPLRTRIFV